MPNAHFFLFMLLFGIKRYFYGAKYDTNIKNNTLILYLNEEILG